MPMTFNIPESAFAPFYQTPVAFHGEREGQRPVDLTVMCMVTEDSVSPLGEAVAPTRERAFDVAFPRGSWRELTPPQIGEWVCFKFSDDFIWAKVSQVGRMPDGDFALSAIWSPERKGGPSWS